MPFRSLALLLLASLVLSACSGTGGRHFADGQRRVVYGVDGNGHALYRRPSEPPPRASGAQMCIGGSRGCSPDADDQTAAALNGK